MIAIGEPAAIARRYNELNFGTHDPRSAGERSADGRRARRHRDAEIVDAWFEDADGRADRRDRPPRHVHRACIEVHFNDAARGPDLRRDAAQRRRRHGVRHDDRARRRPDRALRRRRDGDRAAALRDLVHADALHADAVDRARRDWARTRSTCAPTSRRSSCTAATSRPAWSTCPHAFADRAPVSIAPTPRSSARRYGPDAFGDDLRRFVNLTVTLATTDFKLIYFGSVLGYVWSLVRPLLFFTVLYLVFTKIFHVGERHPGLLGPAADRDHHVDLLPAGDQRLRPVPARARGAAAQDALPAPGDPARGRR